MKANLRYYWRKIRQQIPQNRRIEASTNAYQHFSSILRREDRVLSYFSFENELSTHKLNQYLANTQQLYLPKISSNHLLIFQVSSPDDQCSISGLGIYEPIEALCSLVDLSQITTVVVPGLAFDSEHHRLGYGKGFYDRLLVDLSPTATTIGLGFLEQFSKEPLPRETHDISLHKTLLF